MNLLSKISCEAYRNIVRGKPDFVPYFRQATPELELGKLPLGSRPAKRNPNGGVESLRAIPWIFSWSQNRLVLPAWLGAGEAIRQRTSNSAGRNVSRVAIFFYSPWYAGNGLHQM